MPTHAVGIDLGTTHSVAACVNAANHTELLRDSVAELYLPSVVLLDDEKIYVGEEARLRGAAKPDRLVTCVKRQIAEGSSLPEIGGLLLPPEVVQACLLSHLRKNISATLGADFGVVVTVPAFFGEFQRKATVDAAEIAGLRVLDILNEPAAAALAFGEHTGYLSPANTLRNPLKVLVYDLGGFSCEITLLEIEAGGIKTLASEYDLHLGGHDWDFRLADYVAEQFVKTHGSDPRGQPAALEQLLSRAEHAKRSLGLRRATRVQVELGGHTMQVPVTRELFTRLTADLLDRTALMADKLLADAGVAWSEISRVLLTGGATRMADVGNMLRERSGREPDTTVNAEEAVARGAAIYARQLLASAAAGGQMPRFRLANVAAHAIGIEGVDPSTGKRTNKVLIPRGTPLPTIETRKFFPKATAQQNITIVLLEGDSPDPTKCVTIARATIKDLPADMTAEWPIDLTCEYTTSGRLKLDVQIRYTDRAVHLELVRPSGLSSSQVALWKSAVAADKGLAEFEAVISRERRQPIAVASSESADVPSGESHSISALARRYASYVLNAVGLAREDAENASTGTTRAGTTGAKPGGKTDIRDDE